MIVVMLFSGRVVKCPCESRFHVMFYAIASI